MESLEKFAENVKQAFELRYPDECVEIRRVKKNNGVVYTGITVCGDNERVYPTLYLEPFFEESGEEVTEALIDRMCNIYESRRIGNNISFDHLRDYSVVKSRLRCKLINYDANAERLKEIPHRRFLDLVIIPYCIVTESELNSRLSGEASFIVTNNNLTLWDVTADEVIESGIINTFNNAHPKITGMYEMLKRLNPGLIEATGDEIKSCPMFVMTTDDCNGAIAMIYEEVLKKFCRDIDSDIYILPSSINEVIIIPYDTKTSKNMLDGMIKEINQTQLDEVDILSDHAYFFSRETGYRKNIAA